MLEVINPTLKRQLQIIQYLYKNRGVQLRIRELADLVKATEITVRSDIKQINENFPTLHIEIFPKSLIELICPDSFGIEHVYRRIMHLSQEINIFEYLLDKPNQHKKFYLEKFFISESSLWRIIHKWNDFFQKKKLDIRIVTSPIVSVEGNEAAIRKLYYRCLTEKYLGDARNIFFEKDHSIWEIISHLEDIFSVEISYSDHLKLSYWFYVCIRRIKHKYFIQEKYTEANRILSQLLYDEVDNPILKEQFMHDHQTELSIENLLDIMSAYDSDLFITKHLTKDISDYCKNEDLSMIALKDFLLSFSDSIQYDIPFFEQTLALVYFFVTWEYPIPFFFYNRYREFKEDIKKGDPFLLEMFDIHLEGSTLPNDLKYNDELKDQFLYHVIIHTQILLEDSHQIQRKKILILATFSKGFMYSIKKKLENKFKENILVSFYNSNHLSLELGYLKKFDIILTNYNHLSSELDSRIIYMDIGSHEESIEKIQKRLE